MKVHAFRLTKGADLKKEILSFVRKNNIAAGTMLTCVGCLTDATLRMAGAKIINSYKEHLEIVSLVGTVSNVDCHLHISLSKVDGSVIGGHMKDGCMVDTTAEVIIGELEEYIFSTELDETTGYTELKIEKNK